MKNKAHLKTEGIKEIINIKASMKKGLSDELKSNFIHTVPVQKQLKQLIFQILIEFLVS
jgi:hypothetical protein